MNEEELRALFRAEAPPPGLDRWRTSHSSGSSVVEERGLLKRSAGLGERSAGPEGRPTRSARPEERSGEHPVRPGEQPGQPGERRNIRRPVALVAAGLIAAVLAGGVSVAVRLASVEGPSGPGAGAEASPAPSSPSGVTGVSVPPSSGAPAGSSRSATRSGTPSAGAPAAWPDNRTTGVPAGTSLRTHSGDLVVTQAGAVIDAVQVNGSIIVEAPNVKIKRTRVTAGAGAHWVVRQAPGGSDLSIEDSELVGGRAHVGVNQEADGLVVRRAHIRRVDTGVSIGNRGTVEDSLIVDVDAGIGTSSGGSHISVRHNVVTTSPSSVEAAIGLYTKDGPLTAVTVEGNLLAGGNYTFHVGEGPGAQQIVARHNRFSRAVHPKGGFYGPTAGWDTRAAGNVWQDNAWIDTGDPV